MEFPFKMWLQKIDFECGNKIVVYWQSLKAKAEVEALTCQLSRLEAKLHDVRMWFHSFQLQNGTTSKLMLKSIAVYHVNLIII